MVARRQKSREHQSGTRLKEEHGQPEQDSGTGTRNPPGESGGFQQASVLRKELILAASLTTRNEIGKSRQSQALFGACFFQGVTGEQWPEPFLEKCVADGLNLPSQCLVANRRPEADRQYRRLRDKGNFAHPHQLVSHVLTRDAWVR